MIKTQTPEQQWASILRYAVKPETSETGNAELYEDGTKKPDILNDYPYDDTIPFSQDELIKAGAVVDPAIDDYSTMPEELPPIDELYAPSQDVPIGNNRAAKKAELERVQAEHDRKPIFTPIKELMKSRRTVSWVIRDCLPANSTCMIYGESGAGKSFLAIDMALHVAAGKEWQGKTTKKGAVFYIAGEGQDGISERCRAWELHHGIELDDFYCTDGAVIPTNESQLNNLLSEITYWIESTGKEPLLVFFDTLARCFEGDENSAKDAGAYIQAKDKIKQRFKCCVVSVHHSGKDADRGGRGSSAFKGAWDAEHCLKNDGAIKVLSTPKMKNRPEPPPMTFALEQVKTDWLDDDMSVIYSAVLVGCEGAIAKKTKTLSPNNQKMLNVLRTIIDGGESCPQPVRDLFTDSPEQAPEKVVTVDNWQKAAFEVMTVISKADGITDEKEQAKAKKDALRKAFKRGLAQLEKDGLIGLMSDFVWLAYVGF